MNLALGGIITIFGAFIPILAKSILPLVWIDLANTSGWTSELQEIGERLALNGQIEVAPIWVSYLAVFAGAIQIWLAYHLWANRRSARAFGDVFTIGYWSRFYMLKKPVNEVKVKFQSNKRTQE